MTSAFQAGLHLYKIHRHEQAATEFRRHLIEQPEDAAGHAWLALCLTEKEELKEANKEARQAIQLDPGNELGYFVLGRVLLEQNQTEQACHAFRDAIQLNPSNADFYGFLGAAQMRDRHWAAALEAADQGLACDPENSICLNVRTTALTHLGRRDEASRTIQDALASDPENSWTHANHGLAELHAGRPKEALNHFREALRLEPSNQLARSGIVEALKARNFVYRGMLAFFLWMTRLPDTWRWAVIGIIFFAPRVLRGIGEANPDIAWLTRLAVQLLLVFVVMTWIASPLFNLLLRFDRFGRHVLDEDDIRGANLLAVFLFPALALWVASWFAQGETRTMLLLLAMSLGVVVLPAATLYNCEKGWPRTAMFIYLVVLFLMSLSAITTILSAFLAPQNQIPVPVLVVLPGAMLMPVVFYSPLATFFLAQWLTNAKVRR